nr:expansin-A13-like [Ipomoea batatas]
MPDSTVLLLLYLFAFTLLSTTSLVFSHDGWSLTSSAAASLQSEWRPARATYYAPADPEDAVGGACGYGDLEKSGYGKATAGLSTILFERGQICGACFEVKCVEDLRWCIPGTSIIVTATNFCAPNYGFEPDGGGHCNPPNAHFVLPIEAFEKIAIWKASNMPIQYRRIKCRKEGGVRFAVSGAGIFISVLIRNVAGTGDIIAVKIKGSRTGWLPMGRNWGQNWHINANLRSQPLSFEITSSDRVTLTSYNVAPKNWNYGQTFEGKQFEDISCGLLLTLKSLDRVPILAPRIGYLPLLAPQVKPFFSGTLPPGVDTVWFEYKGLPLKWYIPIGVLFDLLCAEPERPWNLTAAYIINGNCKNIMNMSQSDQSELWRSVVNRNLEAYLRVSSKLKLGIYGDDFSIKLDSSKFRQSSSDGDAPGAVKTGRIPVRLYVRSSTGDFEYVEDAPAVESWDKISYINRPIEIHEDGKLFTLGDAVKSLLPECFVDNSPTNTNTNTRRAEEEVEKRLPSEETNTTSGQEKGEASNEPVEPCAFSDGAEIKVVRIQGIEPKLEIPFAWVVKNLMNPEYFLHICVYIKTSEPIAI